MHFVVVAVLQITNTTNGEKTHKKNEEQLEEKSIIIVMLDKHLCLCRRLLIFYLM